MQKPRLTKKVVDALYGASGHLRQEIQNNEFLAQGLYELHDQAERAVKYLDQLCLWYNYKQEKNNE